jgi:hypothetical protein
MDKDDNPKVLAFKDYMKKYRPANVWERLSKNRQAHGLNISVEHDIDTIFDGKIIATNALTSLR